MTKRFELGDNLDKRTIMWDNEKDDWLSFTEVWKLLNALHEETQFKRKHILCLQSVIQTIDVELQEKGMTKERFGEIKTYWYRKFKGDFE